MQEAEEEEEEVGYVGDAKRGLTEVAHYAGGCAVGETRQEVH